MSDELVKALSLYGDHGEEEAWENFKSGFLTKSPEFRKESLRITDGWIATHMEGHTGVTKELGSLLNRKRELESIHRRLRELNR